MTALAEVRGKTEQRVERVVNALRKARGSLTYAELTRRTDTQHDILLYILTTLQYVGLVERLDEVNGPGRPTASFRWVSEASAQEMGS